MDVKKFYTRLNEAINTAKIRQNEMADILCVSRNTISNWKKGIGIPSCIQLYTIAKFCNKSVNWFFDEFDSDDVRYLKEKIKSLEETVNMQKDFINKLEKIAKIQ
jgi:transcriptional regulator with XRE-family HTH domain